ncbi:type IV secretion system protein TraC (plasmid) [Bermanella marisrubri]|uniref:ATPase n=1 Tax=Bermanella marisrubri TaxID=207949 RepID=Q1MY39_9GAMM|nr:type IV secretion system protein TraC [Bermanella marisrubri]EAT10857.1 ATPase [Oceanobacter sp. RED65] [Bermanella marisrubri]QIZ85910.1 type IV secretion system protein TraC [Bermanella marisrubri]
MIELLEGLNYRFKQFLTKALTVNPPGYAYAAGHEIPTIQQQKAFMNRYNLSSLFPWESYDETRGIFFNEDSVGFCLEASPSTGLSEADFKTLEGVISRKHEADSTIQFTIVADSNVDGIYKSWERSRTRNFDDPAYEIFQTLSENRRKYLLQGKWKSLFSGMPYVVRNFRLIISFTIPKPRGGNISQTTVDALSSKRESIIASLKGAKVHSKLVHPQDLINLVSALLHPTDDGYKPVNYDENSLIKDQIVSSETAFLPGRDGSSIIYRDKKVSVLPWSVRQYPQYWKGSNSDELIGSFLDNVRQIPCPFITTMSINFPDRVDEGGKIKQKTMRATQMADSAVSKFVPQWKKRASDWRYIEEKFQNGSSLVKTLYQVVLFAPQGEEESCEQALQDLYESYGWNLQKDRFIPVHGFLSALPMIFGREFVDDTNRLRRYRRMLTWNAINVSPLFGEWQGDGNNSLLMHGRRGQVMTIDPYQNKAGNFNIACSASSGAGKSFFTHEMIFSVLGEGGKVIVFDSGRSYEETVTLLGGQYLDFGDKTRTICLNPFTNIPLDEGGLKDHLPLLKILISNMASPSEDIPQIMKSALEQAIAKAFAKFRNKCSVTRVIEELLEMNSDESIELSKMLYPYSRDGVYGEYFEGDANIDLQDRFVVLELDDLAKKPGLQEIVLLILMMNINEVFYHSDRSQKKLCIIDEAWRLLQGRAGDFIEEGYRVARKYGGAFMTVTQRIADYYTSPVAQAAYANADHTWLLRQKTDELRSSIERGEIDGSKGKFEVFNSLKTEQGKYSEIAFMSPAGLGVGRLIVDPVTEKLYSTKAEEVQFLRNKRKEGVDLMTALTELAGKNNSR